eukprot:2928264-Prymnesium_polylepis.1
MSISESMTVSTRERLQRQPGHGGAARWAYQAAKGGRAVVEVDGGRVVRVGVVAAAVAGCGCGEGELSGAAVAAAGGRPNEGGVAWEGLRSRWQAQRRRGRLGGAALEVASGEEEGGPAARGYARPS